MEEIEQVVLESKKQINLLNDCNAQLINMANVVDKFVMQTLQAITENEDIAGVNEILANALLQIRNFVSSRPNEVSLTKLKLEQRLVAYRHCLDALSKEKTIVLPEENIDFQTESKEVLTTEKKNRIAEKLDEDGKYPSHRPPGVRPEKLRDIRRVEGEIETSKNFKEDI